MAEYDNIRELVELMKDFDLVEIEIKEGDKEIKLKKAGQCVEMPLAAMMPEAVRTVAAGGPPPVPAQSVPAAESAPADDPNLFEFKSPMVGSFYRAPSPESPPFVTEGDKVNSDTILCIVEAMKVMNEIKAETQGEITEILVENGEAVEFGQPLFLIRRAG